MYSYRESVETQDKCILKHFFELQFTIFWFLTNFTEKIFYTFFLL